ncbi:MAG: ferritin-like domain-containing protein [bacterium]|nr:ferritin-like domain-containing protein [bacterium]
MQPPPETSPQAPAAGTVERWCWDLILCESLAGKLDPGTPPDPSSEESWENDPAPRRLLAPGRPMELQVIDRSPKGPKKGALVHKVQRARLFHTMAHHELQAAELFAWALLAFPDTPQSFRKTLMHLVHEEVRHLHLYLGHLKTLGHSYGDWPVRDWFWQRLPSVPDALHFVSLIGLGLEGANLEHAARFAEWFRAAGDEAGARVMDQIEEEEIAHVTIAHTWYERFSGEALDYDRWADLLPSPLSPALFRGLPLNRSARTRAGLPAEFLQRLESESPAHLPAKRAQP